LIGRVVVVEVDVDVDVELAGGVVVTGSPDPPGGLVDGGAVACADAQAASSPAIEMRSSDNDAGRVAATRRVLAVRLTL
jgi:hypothetical protein